MGQSLVVSFERKKCAGVNCKSEEEIDEFIDGLKINLFYNTQRYNPRHYNDTMITNHLEKAAVYTMQKEQKDDLIVYDIVESEVVSFQNRIDLFSIDMIHETFYET